MSETVAHYSAQEIVRICFPRAKKADLAHWVCWLREQGIIRVVGVNPMRYALTDDGLKALMAKTKGGEWVWERNMDGTWNLKGKGWPKA